MSTRDDSPLMTDVCHSKPFRIDRLNENLKRMRRVAWLYIGLLLWFGTLNIIAIMTGVRQFQSVDIYGLLYGAMITVNIGVVLFIKPGMMQDPEKIERYERVVELYIMVVMTLGALISLADQRIYGHLYVYIMSILICASFFITESRQILFSIGFTSGVMFFGLPYILADTSVQLATVYQELLSYTPIAFFISRAVYQSFCDHSEGKARLQEETEKNEELNRQLTVINRKLQVANDRLNKLAIIDELTGIANRRGLHQYLEALFKVTPKDRDRTFAVSVIDIDFFKEYNDEYGHVAGDEILKSIAATLSEIANDQSGFMSRWGGEEFVFVAPDRGVKESTKINELVHKAISDMEISHERSSVGPYLTLSIGTVVAVVRDVDDVMHAIHEADDVLYEVKGGGRDGYRIIAASSDDEPKSEEGQVVSAQS